MIARLHETRAGRRLDEGRGFAIRRSRPILPEAPDRGNQSRQASQGDLACRPPAPFSPDDVTDAFGRRDYQSDRNDWHQNGHDAFLTELAKYGLGVADLAANLNWFSRVEPDADGALTLMPRVASETGTTPVASPPSVTLRMEMDTLVVRHTCPHPLHPGGDYPQGAVEIALGRASPPAADDACLTHCPENRRGSENNALHHLGGSPPDGGEMLALVNDRSPAEAAPR
mgnify:CR=1 FL=1